MKKNYKSSTFIVLTVFLVSILAAEVSAVEKSNCPSGMVSYWNLDEDSGTTANDVFGVNDGQLIGGPVWTTGQVGNALQFSGTNRVMIADSDSLTTPDALTLEAWIYPTNPWQNNRAIVAKQDITVSPYAQEYGLIMLTDGGLQFHACPSGGCAVVGVVSRPVPVNQWTYVVGVWNSASGIAMIYINGLEAPADYRVTSTGQIPNTQAHASIGDYHTFDGTYAFQGAIDEVAIYNRALSAEEIQQHYQNGLNGLGYCEAAGIISAIIDIKPGSFPNSINLKSKGNVPVAILSDPTFDATTVDQNTVVFAGASPLPIGQTPQDVNGDGLLDVVLHFKTQDLNLQIGDTEACLTGQTFSGQEFEGCDSVRIVK